MGMIFSSMFGVEVCSTEDTIHSVVVEHGEKIVCSNDLGEFVSNSVWEWDLDRSSMVVISEWKKQ